MSDRPYTKKIDWWDYLANSIVTTPKGEGLIVAINMVDKTVSVQLEGVGIEQFNPESIGWRFGTIQPTLSLQVGQFILLFQSLENMNKNFLRNVNLSDTAHAMTAGKLIAHTDECLRGNTRLNPKSLLKWDEIRVKYFEMNAVRHDLVHGQRFEITDLINGQFGIKHVFYNQKTKKGQELTKRELNEIVTNVLHLYYQLFEFFEGIGDELIHMKP
jgi:hypothetical protein